MRWLAEAQPEVHHLHRTTHHSLLLHASCTKTSWRTAARARCRLLPAAATGQHLSSLDAAPGPRRKREARRQASRRMFQVLSCIWSRRPAASTVAVPDAQPQVRAMDSQRITFGGNTLKREPKFPKLLPDLVCWQRPAVAVDDVQPQVGVVDRRQSHDGEATVAVVPPRVKDRRARETVEVRVQEALVAAALWRNILSRSPKCRHCLRKLPYSMHRALDVSCEILPNILREVDVEGSTTSAQGFVGLNDPCSCNFRVEL